MPIAHSSVQVESLQFDQCFRPLFSHFAAGPYLYQVKFTDTSSADKTARNITKILRSFGFQLKFESFRFVQ